MTVKRLWCHPLARVKFPNAEKMQSYLDMIRAWEPMVTNVIGFMDSLGLTTECTDKRITQNVYYCGYDCDTMVNNVLVFGPEGKVFFVLLIILGVGPMEHSLLVFSVTSKRGLVNIRNLMTWDFLELEMQLVFLSGWYPRGAPIDCMVLSVIILFVWVTFILLFDRKVNGECVDYRGASLAVKTACRWTRTRGRWCWRVLFFYTIFELRLLGLIRSQR
jgi:hypothetical protein